MIVNECAVGTSSSTPTNTALLLNRPAETSWSSIEIVSLLNFDLHFVQSTLSYTPTHTHTSPKPQWDPLTEPSLSFSRWKLTTEDYGKVVRVHAIVLHLQLIFGPIFHFIPPHYWIHKFDWSEGVDLFSITTALTTAPAANHRCILRLRFTTKHYCFCSNSTHRLR